MHYFIHSECESCHLIFMIHDFMIVFFQGLLNIRKLYIVKIAIIYINFMISFGRWILFQLCKSSNGCSTGRIMMILPISCIFSNCSIRSYADMRSKQNKKISTMRNVMAECSEANFANEWNSAETSHIETFSPVVS